ncbi:MAG: hypothetical protein HOD87_05215 [Gammaproteobacteria bacterium]|nr:hypothetical protein [Gammaproteobacteria bacterium]
MHAGEMFIEPKDIKQLEEAGTYEKVIPWEVAQHVTHPDIGDSVDLLLDDTSSGRRVRVYLVSDERLPDGQIKSIYKKH